ncbi:cyclase, partial [Streptomyces sp. NPDC059970]
YPSGFFEKTGNLWRAQGRRMRLDFKHFQRYVSLAQEEPEGWRGEIRDGEVIVSHEDAMEEEEAAEQEDAQGEESEDEEYEEEPEDDEPEDEDYEDEDEPEDEEEGEYEEEEEEEGEEEDVTPSRKQRRQR